MKLIFMQKYLINIQKQCGLLNDFKTVFHLEQKSISNIFFPNQHIVFNSSLYTATDYPSIHLSFILKNLITLIVPILS